MNAETDRKAQLLEDFYALGGSYAKLAEKEGISRQRIHQMISDDVDPDRLKAVQDVLAAKIVEVFKETGSYTGTTERVGAGYYKVKEIVDANLTEQEIKEAAKSNKRATETSYKIFEIYADQQDFVDGLDNVSGFVREALDMLLKDPNAEKLVERNLVGRADDFTQERGGFAKAVNCYITKEQNETLDEFTESFGKGAKAAALRAAIDYKRVRDAAYNAGGKYVTI